jgi:hypothetical protein
MSLHPRFPTGADGNEKPPRRLLGQLTDSPQQEIIDRSVYFQEPLRLQRELVKLQDWVAAMPPARVA